MHLSLTSWETKMDARSWLPARTDLPLFYWPYIDLIHLYILNFFYCFSLVIISNNFFPSSLCIPLFPMSSLPAFLYLLVLYRTVSFTALPLFLLHPLPLSFHPSLALRWCPWLGPPLGEMMVIEVMEHRWNRIRCAYWEWGTMSLNTIWDFYPSLRLSGSAAYIYIWASPLTLITSCFTLKGYMDILLESSITQHTC